MGVLDNQLNWRKVYQNTAADLHVTSTPEGVTSQPVINVDPDLLRVTNTPDGTTVQPVSPDAPIDVTGWTLAQKMRLPDWCFGNRKIIGVFKDEGVVTTFDWNISEDALPDPACIWQVLFVSQPDLGGKGYMRVGLDTDVPTSVAEMNAATELFPSIGEAHAGPNIISFYGERPFYWSVDLRKGMVTGGKKLVIEVYCSVTKVRFDCELVVSGLPTEVPAFLNPGVP